MIRLFKYRCPKDTEYGQCHFPWPTKEGSEGCSNCGVSHNESMTVWDKIAFAYWRIVPHGIRPKNAWYKFSCWAWKRYTTTKPRNLGHEWCDRSHLVLYSVFEIATKFVQGEGVNKLTQEDWDFHKEHNPGFYESWKTTKEISDWWLANQDLDFDGYRLNDEEYDRKYPFEVPSDYPGTRDEYRSLARYKEEGKFDEVVRAKAQKLIEVSPYWWT